MRQLSGGVPSGRHVAGRPLGDSHRDLRVNPAFVRRPAGRSKEVFRADSDNEANAIIRISALRS